MMRREIAGGARYEVTRWWLLAGPAVRGLAYGGAALAVLVGWPA